MPDGAQCPICALGECGDPKCPTYRPKHPEVREAIERLVVDRCSEFFGHGGFETYVSVGCGLLAQDWVILEKLRLEGLLPTRAIFIELKAAKPVISVEGGHLPLKSGRGLDLRQTGFFGVLGPEFSLTATVEFSESMDQHKATTLFDFGNGPNQDNIFVEVGGPEAEGMLVFGVYREYEPRLLSLDQVWKPGDTHTFLFTVSATGNLRIYMDGYLICSGSGHPPRPVKRHNLSVGHSSTFETQVFRGAISKVKVWDHEVDVHCSCGFFESEMDSAVSQFAQWYAEDLSVWTFGSLGSYVAAVAQDSRFAADVLLRVDVHDEIDGYDDFACKALSGKGLALTLGGPGKSWRRSGGGWKPIDVKCEILDRAEANNARPWCTKLGGSPKNNYNNVRKPRLDISWPQRRRTSGGAGARRQGNQASADPALRSTPTSKSSRGAAAGRSWGACAASKKVSDDALPSLEELLARLDQEAGEP